MGVKPPALNQLNEEVVLLRPLVISDGLGGRRKVFSTAGRILARRVRTKISDEAFLTGAITTAEVATFALDKKRAKAMGMNAEWRIRQNDGSEWDILGIRSAGDTLWFVTCKLNERNEGL